MGSAIIRADRRPACKNRLLNSYNENQTGQVGVCAKEEGAMKKLLVLMTVVLSVFATAVAAQEKHKFFFKAPTASDRYTQQYLIEVGDAPGHHLRVAELQAKYTTDGPVFDGVKVTAVLSRLTSDYVEGNGRGQGYQIYMLETGEKIFARFEVLAQTTAGADGSRKSSFNTLITLTGGSGKFKLIRGSLRSTGSTDFKSGTSGVQTEGEYWFESR